MLAKRPKCFEVFPKLTVLLLAVTCHVIALAQELPPPTPLSAHINGKVSEPLASISKVKEKSEFAINKLSVKTKSTRVAPQDEPDPEFSVHEVKPEIEIDPHLEVLDEKYAKCNGIDIRELSVLGIQELFASNQLTSEALVKCYLERLDKMNEVLRVVVETNPEALEDAKKRDEERKVKTDLGAMHGIPVLLKDGIGTLDKTQTTVGSPALLGLKPVRDAPVVTALRQAGAVILGKSHCQEIYGFRGTNIPNGWSGRGGQTRNPYNINTTPSGSSSGSAVGVGANLIPVALGTETDGSILEPAGLSGLVGLKPTIGYPSVKGIVPISKSYDHVGPMAKSVTDAAVLLDAMVSGTERPPNHPQSYSKDLTEKQANRAFRIGVVRNPFWNTDAINSTHLRFQVPYLNRLLQEMNKTATFEVVDPVDEPIPNVSLEKFSIVLFHEFKDGFNRYLRDDVVNEYSQLRPNNPFPKTPESYLSSISPVKKIESLQDVITYNIEHPTVQGFNQDYLVMAQATDNILNETYINARESNNANARAYFEMIFKKYNLDAIATPSASESRDSPILDPKLQDFPVFGFTMACITGYPSITVPAGIGLRGVPFGITFIAKPSQEPDLLRVAYAVEQLNPKRKMPQFLI